MNEDRSLVQSIQFIFNQGTVGEENNRLLPPLRQAVGVQERRAHEKVQGTWRRIQRRW